MKMPRLLRVGRTLVKGTARWITSVTKREALAVRIALPMLLYAGTWAVCEAPGNQGCSVWFIDHALTDQFGPNVMLFLALGTAALLGLGLLWAHSGWKRKVMRRYIYQGMELINDLCMLLVGCALAIALVNSVFSYFIIWSWGLVALFLVLWFCMVFLVRLPLLISIRRPMDAYVGMLLGLALFVGALYGEHFLITLVHAGI